MGEPTPTPTLASLEELKTISVLTQRLSKVRSELSQQADQASAGLAFTIEVDAERGLLKQEKAELLRRLRAVQEDIDELDSAIVEAEGRRNLLQRERQRIINEEYDPLKESIDTLRARHGLARLPTLQEEEDMETTRILEERRLAWLAASRDASSSPLESQASGSASAAATRGGRRTQRSRPRKRRRSQR